MRLNLYASISLLLLFDILTKWLAIKYLAAPLILAPDFLQLAVSFNTGVAFSVPLPNAVMIFLTPVILALFVWFIHREFTFHHIIVKIAASAIIAGGIGNLINRLLLGAVVDFIDFSFWPSFNFADMYLTIAALSLIIFYGKIRVRH